MVFDMCAAPGSKTSQMLEQIMHDYNISNTNPKEFIKGAVVCNDMDYKRAYMLTHQVKRLNTSCMLIANHIGQFYPTLYRNDCDAKVYDKKFYYDKVLADVPCSGDGAIRKLPLRWKIWKCNDGLSLHCVQVALLIRAIQMTKIGGSVVYSTCSLSPIENEAVITEVMRNVNKYCKGALELLDVHEKMKGFKGRRGLYKW